MKNSNISEKDYAHLQNELKEISWAWLETTKKVEQQNIIIHDQHTRLLNFQDKTAELRDRGDSLLEELTKANAFNIQLIADKAQLFTQLQAQLQINDELRAGQELRTASVSLTNQRA